MAPQKNQKIDLVAGLAVRRLLGVLSEMRFVRALLLAGCLLSMPLAQAAPPKSTPTRSASGSTVTLAGIEYLSANEIARRHGLKASWSRPGKTLVLAGNGQRVVLEVGGREAEVNGLRVFLGEGTRLYRQSLYVSRIDADRFLSPILEPDWIKTPVAPITLIALDAGHGGRDTGKVNNKLKVYEKTFTLDVVQRAKKLLEARGYRVFLTRTDDRFIELEDRPALAQKAGADLFVSVHFNSVERRPEQVSGVEVFSMTPQYQYSTDDYEREATDQARVANPGNRNDPWNSLLAYHLHRELIRDLKVPDRGHKRQRFKVLRLAMCPAVLVEAGYLSNDAEARRISTPAYRQDLAESIVDGIVSYITAVKSTR